TITLDSINAFSTWTLGNEVEPLPVNLLWYTAKRHQQHALLEWKTASEKENAGFILDVSKNGKDFTYLGKVEVKNANNISGAAYSFVDERGSKFGVQYYRLTQIDENGSKEILGTRAVKFDDATLDFSVYPNPFTDNLTLLVQTPAAANLVITITNSVGKLMYSREAHVEKGNNRTDFTVGKHLPAGSYFLRLESEGNVYNKLLIKQ
ncbi:MAG: T9SS type A sorting domain-containing protein, partial [Chitinophagaceae bacterium]